MIIKRVSFSPIFILDAIEGARLSYGSDHRMDSYIENGNLTVGENDYKLIKKLSRGKAGGEDKFLRTIPVGIFLSASSIWWRQADTYKVGTTRQSASMMHYGRKRGEFELENFNIDRTDELEITSVNNLNAAYREWAESGEPNNSSSRLWLRWQRLVPASFMYSSHFMCNYAVLKTMYAPRKKHRNDEWSEFFNGVLTQLPLSELITQEY